MTANKLRLLTASALLLVSTAASATVSNGDFESWSGNTPASWSTIDTGISLSPSTTVVHGGAQAAEIIVNTGTQSATDLRQTVSVVSGQSYDFSVWVYHTEGNLKARLYIGDYQNYSDNSLTGQWQQISYSYTATSTGSLDVGLRFYDQSGFDGSEVVYIDDFEPATSSDGSGNTDDGSSDSDGADTGDTSSCTTTNVNLTTDNYGSETSWTISNSSGDTVASGSGYSSNTEYSESSCLEAGEYTFTITDTYGDGICCSYGNGAWAVVVDGTEVLSGDQFTSSDGGSFSVAANDADNSDADSSDSDSGSTDNSCISGSFSLTTDNYGSETSWVITNSAGSSVASGSGYSSNTSTTESLCLDAGSYTFTITDSYGDGICCSHGDGAYELVFDGVSVASGSSFSSSASASFVLGSDSGSDSGSDTGSDSGSGDGSGTGSELTGYYASADGLSGYALKTELAAIITSGHSNQGYSALWTFYSNHERDNYYEMDGSLLDIYSENPTGSDAYTYTSTSDQCGNYSGEGSCYNREHSFPKSWFNDGQPMYSDVHHLFASDGYVNGKRGNYPYGEVGSASFTSSNGSKLGSAASGLGYSGTVFEPIDEFKGDLARAYFYMATRYESQIANWENNSSSSDAVLDGSSDQVFEEWQLEMLINWHNADPVSQKELDRNEAAYDYQGNRNPYVDHPELVEAIWGN